MDELEILLVDGKECVYVIFIEKGIVSCGIEDVYNVGEVDFRKLILCYLYFVRV